ncbi:MAG: hypothetical protein ACXABC_01555 [Candidatus Thorarchaeota archaeon]|jgi:dolichol kinase
MVELYFGDLTTIDIIMALATGLAGGVVLALAYKMSASGWPKWKPRKLVHTSMSSVIGITLVGYSNLSGPALAAGIFLTVLFYAWAHKSELIWDLLLAGSREDESNINTMASGLMGLIAFGAAFILFLPQPAIFVAAILAVSWGDAAGEVVGRSLGGSITSKRFRKKSLEGSIAVFCFAFISIMTALAMYSVEVCPLCVLPQLAAIAVVIAIVELLSTGWMDNFFIPLITAVLMWIMLFPTMSLLWF